MKFGEFVSADICQAAVEQSPAHRATLYHRKRKVAEKRLHECSGLSWGTAETLSCVYASDHAVTCMGGFLIFLFFHCLVHKWRRHKGAYPAASRYTSSVSTKYSKVVGKVLKIWRRKKRAFDGKVFCLKVWCLVLYYLFLGKLYRARTRFKKKVTPLVLHIKSAYMKVTSTIYCHLPPLRVSAVVIFLGLFMSGDIELNPGPKDGTLAIADLKTVRAAVWEARTDWMNIGIELNLIKTDLDAIKQTVQGGNPGECLTEMLTLWLKQVNPPPTWTALVAALKQPTIDLQQLAEKVEKIHVIVNDSNGLSAEVAKLSFPHIKEVAPDDRAREELEHRLRMESKDIMLEFRILQNKFFDSVEEQNIAVDKLVEYLEQEVSDALQQREIDSEPVTLKEVKQFIKRHSSFYDYQLVKYMIKLIGTDKDKEQLKQYEDAFIMYAKRRIYECPSTFCSSNDSDSELHVKLDLMYGDREDDEKLEELKDFQYRLCSILRISVYTCRLKSSKKGCFLLTFLIPCRVQETAFPLSIEQEKALHELGVRQLTCGSYRFPRIGDQDNFEDIDKDDDRLPPSGATKITEMKHHNDINQPSIVATSSIKHTMSVTDYLIFAHVSAQQHYSQQLQGDMRELTLSAAKVTSHSTIEYKNVRQEVSVHNTKNIDKMEEWNEAKRKFHDSDYETASNVTASVAKSVFTEDSVDKTVDIDEEGTVEDKLKTTVLLFMAGLRGDINKLKEIVQQTKIDWQNYEFFGGYSVLHLAAVEGYVDILKFLIENEGCSHSPKTSWHGRTPLHLAAQHSQLEIVRYLVCDCSADPSEQDDNGLTALHHACMGGNLEIVTLLIDEMNKYIPANSVVVEKIVSGDTALHLAAQMGHVNIIRHFHQLQCLEIDSNLKGDRNRNNDNLTPLHVAALSGHLDVVRFLISEFNCDPNIQGSKLNRTPLHCAAQEGHLNIIKYLIEEKQCSPLCQDIYMDTPLYITSMKGHLDTVKYLTMDKNCDPAVRNSENATPLHIAAVNGHYEVVNYLISELNCNPNIPGWKDTNRTPLHFAAENGHLQIVRYLIEKEHCNPSCQDANEVTPLYLASKKGHLETVKYLTLDKHCDPVVRNDENATPLHIATLYGHFDVVRFLVSELNCDPNTQG